MTTINIIKTIVACISVLLIASWYTVFWLYKKNDKYAKPAVILTFTLPVMTLLVCAVVLWAA